MKRKMVLVLTFLMLLAGIGIMLYPTVSSLVNARSQSQVIAEYQEQVASLSQEEVDAYFAAAEAYNERLRSSSIVLTDPFDEAAQQIVSEDYYDLLNIDGGGVMGYINMNIPERDIYISLPIYHGTSQTVLALGAGHLEGSSLPVGGEGTHSVLSAHTGLMNARMFNDLAKLQDVETFTDGDIFTVTVLGEVLTYQVYSVQVVEPSDTSSLFIQKGEDLVTLVTCTPYGINSHRLLVHGVRISTTEETVAEAPVTALQVMTFSWEYLVAGGTVILAVILLFVLMIYRRRKRRRRIRSLWQQVRG